MTNIFQEKQKINQWWLWLIIAVTSFIIIFLAIKQLYFGETVGTRPMSNLALIVLLIFTTILFVFIFVIQLSLSINEERIEMKFFPLFSKTIKWDEVQSVQIVNYGFVGGWGIRLGSEYGTVYNIKGKMGLFLSLKNGKKICIGTQRVKDLQKAILLLPISDNIIVGNNFL